MRDFLILWYKEAFNRDFGERAASAPSVFSGQGLFNLRSLYVCVGLYLHREITKVELNGRNEVAALLRDVEVAARAARN